MESLGSIAKIEKRAIKREHDETRQNREKRKKNGKKNTAKKGKNKEKSKHQEESRWKSSRHAEICRSPPAAPDVVCKQDDDVMSAENLGRESGRD